VNEPTAADESPAAVPLLRPTGWALPGAKPQPVSISSAAVRRIGEKANDTDDPGDTPMRKLAANTFISLDGVMQAPGGPQEDPSGGFTHGGWSFNYWDDVMGQVMGAAMETPYDLLLGRKTYEIFAAHWPHAGDDNPAATSLNAAHKYVASRTLDHAGWGPATLIRDVPAEVAKLKAQDGVEIQVHGSSDLLQTLLKHDLVDELRVWTFPVLLGGGKRLFGDGIAPGGLKLVGSTVATSGVIIATYKRAGAIQYGSFALEEPTPEEVERRARLDR
jgi:dihydrofolate reductase